MDQVLVLFAYRKGDCGVEIHAISQSIAVQTHLIRLTAVFVRFPTEFIGLFAEYICLHTVCNAFSIEADALLARV